MNTIIIGKAGYGKNICLERIFNALVIKKGYIVNKEAKEE